MKGFFKRFKSSNKELRNFIKSQFGVSAKNIQLYELALTHSSHYNSGSKGKRQSNERLEFLGDAILDAIVANYLYNNYPSSTEGELTKLKSKVVSRKNLNLLAFQTDLHKFVKHSLNSDSKETSILGNALEALIGAIYLDHGYLKCERVLLKFLETADLEQMLYEQKDYKSLIHEWCQQKKKEVSFPTLNEGERNGRIYYEVSVIISGSIHGKGSATSKKKAQQIAAREACLKLHLV